jgi:hypothetical protein
MAQRRQKVLETDSATAKFLYTIIKQLDLKSVSLLGQYPVHYLADRYFRLIGTE